MDALQLQNVTKAFANTIAVDDLTLSVPEGSICGFIGPNGSGKTTAMRMIANIIHPDQGTIKIFGSIRSTVRSHIVGYLPEERGLYRQMSVQSLLEFHAALQSGQRMTGEIKHWLGKFDLAHCASQKLATLSKGMSQKVQFIAAVISRPNLVILDEAFSGLDPLSADAIKDAIQEMRHRGAAIILSTHDMNTAETMCDYVVMLYRGKTVLDGTMSSIHKRYGKDTIRISLRDGAEGLREQIGIESVCDLGGGTQEVRFKAGYDPQLVLQTLWSHGQISSFSVVKPSLHDIFVKIAGCRPQRSGVEDDK
jgi:ABC-2 type transport system ATP-binding protein